MEACADATRSLADESGARRHRVEVLTEVGNLRNFCATQLSVVFLIANCHHDDYILMDDRLERGSLLQPLSNVLDR